MLGAVWRAYDELHASNWANIPWQEDFDDLERLLSEELVQAIRRNMDGFMPVYAEHGPYERETRSASPAQPRQYDIAFKANEKPWMMWPLEAKVLKSDADTNANLGDYVETLKERYLNCVYAPFSNSGAMLAYMKAPDPETAATHIATRLACSLAQNAEFADRCHKTSHHKRKVPAGKSYPDQFKCHHLLMPLYQTEKV